MQSREGWSLYRRARAFSWDVLSVQASKYARRSSYWPSRFIEISIILLILCNVTVGFFMEAIRQAHGPYPVYAIDSLTIGTSAVFLIEYLARAWACVEDERYSHPFYGRLRWMRKPLSAFDFLVLSLFMSTTFVPAVRRNCACLRSCLSSLCVCKECLPCAFQCSSAHSWH